MKNSSFMPASRREYALVAVKLAHTAVWAFFVGCIVGLPIAGWYRRFDIALILAGLVLFECGVLALNRGRCPLTGIAAQFTNDRSPAFDIYLPAWLAARNKVIFGTLFALNGLVVLLEWLIGRHTL